MATYHVEYRTWTPMPRWPGIGWSWSIRIHLCNTTAQKWLFSAKDKPIHFISGFPGGNRLPGNKVYPAANMTGDYHGYDSIYLLVYVGIRHMAGQPGPARPLLTNRSGLSRQPGLACKQKPAFLAVKAPAPPLRVRYPVPLSGPGHLSFRMPASAI